MALLECLQSVTADQKTIELVRVSLVFKLSYIFAAT